LGARIIWSVTLTKFDTVRGVRVAVGACWAYPVKLRAHSRAALSSDSLIGHLIAPSHGFKNAFVGREILIEALI